MAAKEPTVERRHRLAASELVDKVAAAWVDNPAATFGLSTREVDLLTRAAELLAAAEQAASERAWDEGKEAQRTWARGALALPPVNPYRLPKGPTK